jgi:N utilization substance protein B
VVLNEAIELGKSFGGTGGHKYVNGVLEKLAGELRPEELARARQTV